MHEILFIQWLKCLLCCWIRAYARIWEIVEAVDSLSNRG